MRSPWFTLWILGLGGCILGPRPDTCTTNAECRDAFGFGSVCGADGYCDALVPSPRCESTFPEDLFTRPENYQGAVVLGSIFNMPFDEQQRLSAELAIRNTRDAEDSNAAYGAQVAIIHCDNGEDIAYDALDPVGAAAEVARFLAEDVGVQAIIGPSTSDESFAVFDAASPHGAITISPSATSPTLTPLGGFPTEDAPGLFWRTVPPDDLQAFAIAEDMIDRGVTNIVILHQQSSYATALADAVEANFGGGGRGVTRLSYTDVTSLSNATDDAFANGADEVAFFTSETSEVVLFLDRAASVPEALDRPIFLADAAADTVLFDAGNGAVLFPNVRGSRPAVPKGDLFEDFVGNYEIIYGESPASSVFTSYTFDATWLALYGAIAARQEPTLTGDGIGRGILRLGEGAPTRVGYETLGAVRTALESGGTVDIEGASGPLDFDPATGEVSNAIEIWVIDADAEAFVPVRICEPGGACTDVVLE